MRFRISRALGAELARATAERELRRRRARRMAGPVAVVVLGVVSVAGARGVLLERGAPVPVERSPGTPVAATLEPVRAADPHGGPPWGIRVATLRDGRTCTTVGRVHDDTFGALRGRELHPLPLVALDQCVALGRRDVAALWSQYPGENVDLRSARTVVHGLAGGDVSEVIVRRGAGERRVEISPRRAFVAAFDGLHEPERLPIVARFRNGGARRVAAEGWTR
jgi:hypothetical protein